MAWTYCFGGKSATHIESGTVFAVSYLNRNAQSVDDLTIVPDAKSSRRWTDDAILVLKQELWDHIQDSLVRVRVATLIQREFLGDNHRAASAISNVTGKRVSERTIQAWLIDPSKVSSRKCPAWALKAMQDYLAVPDNKRYLSEIAQYREQTTQQHNYLNDVYDKHQVRMATTSIESEKRALDSWQETNFNSLPIKLFELEKRVDGYLHYLSRSNAIITNALRKCDDFADFKRIVTEELEEAASIEFAVREARKAIEEGLEEFSNDEGLAT